MKRILLIILITLLIIPLTMYVLWLLHPKHELRIVIVDKTVLTKKVQEHISLNWLLKYRKYSKDDMRLYNPQKDYYGFFPDERGGYKIKDFEMYDSTQMEKIADSTDIVYYTDMYGIYRAEWDEMYSKEKRLPSYYAMERSRLIYGGMTYKELDLLKKFKERGKLILTEFNIIASPTSGAVRRDFEKTFGMKWTGWTGRYFESLDTIKNKEIPMWVKRNYTKQHFGNWPFKKSGIIFVREDDRIEILEKGDHLEIEIPIIKTLEPYSSEYNLPDKIEYPFWFDIICNNSTNIQVSKYRLYPTFAGSDSLKRWGIPEYFPAVIKSKDNSKPFYYFAGDFADNPISYNLSKFYPINTFKTILLSHTKQERNTFFWMFYNPLIDKILNDYHKNKK